VGAAGAKTRSYRSRYTTASPYAKKYSSQNARSDQSMVPANGLPAGSALDIQDFIGGIRTA